MKPLRNSALRLAGSLLLLVAAGCSSSRHAAIPGRPNYITPLPPPPPPVIVSSPAQDAAPASPAESSPAETAVRVPTRDANVWREAAKPWLGTPYRLGGLSREGIDCSGFALTLHHEVTQFALPRTTTDQWRSLNAVNVSQLRPGDLLYFNTSGKGVSHVGVSLGGEEFVHASTSKGVMYSSVAEPYWAKSFLGVRRP